MYVHTGAYMFVYMQKKVWKLAHQTANWVTSTEVVLGGGLFLYTSALLEFLQMQTCSNYED